MVHNLELNIAVGERYGQILNWHGDAISRQVAEALMSQIRAKSNEFHLNWSIKASILENNNATKGKAPAPGMPLMTKAFAGTMRTKVKKALTKDAGESKRHLHECKIT